MAQPTAPAAHGIHGQRIRAAPHDWHVRIAGHGPDVLLLHGAGGSGASWERLMPLLPGFRLIAPDLPGQGQTRPGAPRFGLPEMASDLAALARHAGWAPRIVLGHSAGAAIALELAGLLDARPRAVVGVNAALSPFQGVAGWLFPRLARAMTLSPFMSHMVARMAGAPPRIARLIGSTGSTADPGMTRAYHALMSDPRHVAGTLRMLAALDLAPLLARLDRIDLPVLLLAGSKDRAVLPAVSHRSARRLPEAACIDLPGLGHLAHEEAPEAVAEILHPWLTRRAGAEGVAL